MEGYKRWSSPGVNELLHFTIVLVTSALENSGHGDQKFDRSSERIKVSTWWSWAELNMKCRASQRSSSLIYDQPLKTIVSNARSLHFLIQFMSFHGFLFFKAISCILSSKNEHLVFLIVFLKAFQFDSDLELQYALSLVV